MESKIVIHHGSHWVYLKYFYPQLIILQIVSSALIWRRFLNLVCYTSLSGKICSSGNWWWAVACWWLKEYYLHTSGSFHGIDLNLEFTFHKKLSITLNSVIINLWAISRILWNALVLCVFIFHEDHLVIPLN